MTPNNIPEVGDILLVNPRIKEVENYTNDRRIGKKVKVLSIQVHAFNPDILEVCFEYLDRVGVEDKYWIWRDNGTCHRKHPDIPVFVTIDEDNIGNRATVTTYIDKDSIWCTCGGPIKENWALGELFLFCTKCKKEVKQCH